ncbi:hypothetical protein JIR001_02410 [Polycladomyces abyssicola]|uniref:Uncharacterized protein n=1 Tax=Polycladomyces abyssicola TaxID=1125966 RepID=A0A8D5UD08_9BACL|nr:hypothetical protein JIR001_02410 [Polycladomyces abyssicola]
MRREGILAIDPGAVVVVFAKQKRRDLVAGGSDIDDGGFGHIDQRGKHIQAGCRGRRSGPFLRFP